MTSYERINREADLTNHICADCGRLIVGPHVKATKHGVTCYFHTHRCQRVDRDRYEQTGDAHAKTT